MDIVESENVSPQSYPTLCNPMDCGSFVHWILQARILEWVAIPFSRGSSYSGIKPGFPPLQADFFIILTTGKSRYSRGRGVSLWGLGDHPNWSNDLVLTLQLLFLSIIAQINAQNDRNFCFFQLSLEPDLWEASSPRRTQARPSSFSFSVYFFPLFKISSLVKYCWEHKDWTSCYIITLNALNVCNRDYLIVHSERH